MPGGLLTRGQQQFTSTLSRETGLNPRVVGAWALAEQSGGAARGYEGRGYHNWLNIANTDSGPAGGAHSSAWSNPVSAARATAQWLRGQGPIAKEYGAPAAGIRAILSSGRDPMAQIAAIARSGWASSGYNGGADLRSLYGQLSGLKLPPAGGGAGAGTETSSTGLGQTPGTPRLEGGEPPSPQLMGALTGLLSQLSAPQQAPVAAGAAPARPEAYAGPAMPAGARPVRPLEAKPEPSVSVKALLPAVEQIAAQVAGGGAGSPSRVALEPGEAEGSAPAEGAGRALPRGTELGGFLPHGASLKVERVDQGQDIKTRPGGGIIAPGHGYVVATPTDPGGFGSNYPVVHFTSGPLAGRDVYIGHTHAVLKVGAHFGPGDVLSHTGFGTPNEGNARTPGWAEIGLWTQGQGPSSQGGGTTSSGKSIAHLLGVG